MTTDQLGAADISVRALILAAKGRHDMAISQFSVSALAAVFQQQDEQTADGEARLIRAAVELRIATEKGDDGKPLYPNAEARSAAVTIACSLDDRHTQAESTRREAAAWRSRDLADAETQMALAKGERAFIVALGQIAGGKD